VTLAVESERPRVRALYERWGYRFVGVVQDAPEAPRYDILLLDRSPQS
jgi:hypothetical protein